MKKNNSLLTKIGDFENLYSAFKECSKGKRQKAGYQNFLFNHGEKLKEIQFELNSNKTFKWAGYREFEVADPKKRIIMAAPFKDRILHTAIHRIIGPTVDKTFGARTYACRDGLGNRNATIRLQRHLEFVGKKRYCIKLDVKQYFAHIDHNILEKQILNILKDDSIRVLIKDLIASHPRYKEANCGIPIGNLTSQLFANLYLSQMDKLACELLNIDFYDDGEDGDNFYIRYMDDMVIVAQTKEHAFHCANKLIYYASEELKLSIPPNKKVILAHDPIPFLGFVIESDSCRVLARNKRKLIKKIKRMDKAGVSPSSKEMVLLSYNAWRSLDIN